MARIDLPLFQANVTIEAALDVASQAGRRALVIEDAPDQQRMIGFGEALRLMQATNAVSLADVWESAKAIDPLPQLTRPEFETRTVRSDLSVDFGLDRSARLKRVWYEAGGPDELARLVGGVVRCYCRDHPEHSCDPAQLVNGKCPGCDSEVDCG